MSLNFLYNHIGNLQQGILYCFSNCFRLKHCDVIICSLFVNKASHIAMLSAGNFCNISTANLAISRKKIYTMQGACICLWSVKTLKNLMQSNKHTNSGKMFDCSSDVRLT